MSLTQWLPGLAQLVVWSSGLEPTSAAGSALPALQNTFRGGSRAVDVQVLWYKKDLLVEVSEDLFRILCTPYDLEL